MCECENMANSLRDKKITEFFSKVIKNYADEDGKVNFDRLDAILTSLGRKVSADRLFKIRKKLEKDGQETIAHDDPNFIMTIASINVVDIGSIDEDVLNTAFKVFDMVIIQQLNIYHDN